MYKFCLPLLLLIPGEQLVTSQAISPVVAVIEAPDQVNIGDLVVLDSAKSTGDNRLWVVDPKAAGRYLELDTRIVFAIGTPGVYEFQLIVADKQANIAQTKKQVRVGGSAPGPPTPDPTPVPPTPPISSPLIEAVKKATQAVNDPPTATALRQALISLQERTPQAGQAAIAEVLLKRGPESQKKDWLTLWRTPVNAAIEQANLPYEQVIDQLIKGLEQSTQAVNPAKSTLTVFVRPSCPPCEKWKSIELPKIDTNKWNVEFVEDLTNPTPAFQIKHNGKTLRFSGYMTYPTFLSLTSS